MCARRMACGGALFALTLIAPIGPEAREENLHGWFDLAVPGGEATLTGLDVSLDERAFTLPILARALHDRDRRGSVAAARLSKVLADLDAETGSAPHVITVPAPLDADVWRDILPAVQPPARADLFTRLITDRRALLTATGLIATDDSMRAFLARDRDLLRFIYQQGAGSFAVVARRLHVDNGRLVVPGGLGAESVWESLVGVAPTRAGPFLRALLTKDQGRVAWYYDTIAGLDAQRLAAVWPERTRLEAATALYSAFRDPDPQWRISEQPFRRNAVDAWMLVTQNAVAGAGVASALPQQTWALLFSGSRVNQEHVTRTLEGPQGSVSMVWLARETMSQLMPERRTRYEMFRLAQRVFLTAQAASLPDVAMALSGMRDSRALLLTLERMAITDAATWAGAVAAARHVTDDAYDQHASLVTFQGALALLERMRHARTIDVAATTRLVRSLSDAVRVDKRVPRSVAKWMVGSLIPALPLAQRDAVRVATAYESTIVQALAGPTEHSRPRLDWEGLTYVVDPVAAEHARLRAMRTLLPSPTLDAALASEGPRELAQAISALVYATALGDPEGPASLSPDVASRHEFGLTGTTLIREELPWSPPEEQQGYGPWRVQGSLLGLDLGLSRLFLRRIADQQMPRAPTLSLNDFGTMTRTGVAMVASDLTDRERDELAAAIARGRRRVLNARTTAELVALGRECGMSDTTRQLLPWIWGRQRDTATSVFALRDLLWLGHPALSRDALDRWGVVGGGLDGRRVLLMPAPSPWEDYAGRSEMGQVTTQVPDLTLRLVEETARLKLPAQLVPSLLAFALEDYWHDVQARFADDWPRLTRQAAEVSASRIHDYVAALAGGGPLRAP